MTHSISPRFPRFILLALLCAGWHDAQAMTLNEAIGLALRGDPSYLATQANADAVRARSSQAFGRLLPQLSASANSNMNRRDYAVLNTNNTLVERYNSHGAQLNLSQTLLNAEKYFAYSQADFLVNQADFQLAAAEKNMLLRLAEVWLGISQAQDVVSASSSKLQASRKESELAQRGQEKGLMSMAELEAAQARYQQAQAEQVSAQAELSMKLAALEQIVGMTDTPSRTVLVGPLAALDPAHSTLEQWLTQTEIGSPAILAAKRALDAATAEVSKQRSGHLPTVDLVASRNQSVQHSGITGGQAGFSSAISSVGVQLNMPLFSGGEQTAKISEALAMRDKASYELEAALRNARLNVKQAWLVWKASHARQQSGKQAARSAVIALKSAEAQRAHGLKADVDVLQAQQQHDEVLRDWNKARNETILSYLKLRAEIGQLTGSDVAEMERKDEAVLLHQELGIAATDLVPEKLLANAQPVRISESPKRIEVSNRKIAKKPSPLRRVGLRI